MRVRGPRLGLAQLLEQRRLDKLEGLASQSDALALALDAVDWRSVKCEGLSLLLQGADVARELVEAHAMACAVMVAGLDLSTLVVVDCGCMHGLSSLLLAHFLAPAGLSPPRLLWVDKDANCRAATAAPLVRSPPTTFQRADFLEDGFEWPDVPFALMCVRVCGAYAHVRALYESQACARSLILFPCCEKDDATLQTVLLRK